MIGQCNKVGMITEITEYVSQGLLCELATTLITSLALLYIPVPHQTDLIIQVSLVYELKFTTRLGTDTDEPE
jgi:hypothetical protein